LDARRKRRSVRRGWQRQPPSRECERRNDDFVTGFNLEQQRRKLDRVRAGRCHQRPGRAQCLLEQSLALLREGTVARDVALLERLAYLGKLGSDDARTVERDSVPPSLRRQRPGRGPSLSSVCLSARRPPQDEALRRQRPPSTSSRTVNGSRPISLVCMRAIYSPILPRLSSCAEKIATIDSRNGKPGTSP
jgi:hypothetical protein